MDYTTRPGSGPNRAHVNYQCPCGCIGGVIYSAERPLAKAGACCCGRRLWVGTSAEAKLKPYLDDGIDYEWDLGSVTLPWGEEAETAMAWPRGSVEAKLAEKAAGEESLERDPVCGMMIHPGSAAGTSEYKGTTYYFCATACKATFDAAPRSYVEETGVLSRSFKR